ncbi:MAG: hypothetical protein AAFX87_19235 [Bacteroidota bacterium]
MKNLRKLSALILLVIVGAACEQENDVVNPQPVTPTEGAELTTEMSQQVEVTERLNQVRALGFGAPGGIMRDAGSSIIGGRQAKTSSLNRSREVMGLSRLEDDGVCLTQAFILNDDGSFAWVVDFGEDGCEIDGEFWKGKVTEIYREDEESNTFTTAINFDNFGQQHWTLNGTQALEGSYTEDSTAGFSTEYSFVRDLEFVEFDGDEELEKWSVRQVGRERFTETDWTVLEQASDINYVNVPEAEEHTYRNLVAEPLVMNFACEEQGVFVFQDGVEGISYNGEEAIIDFGDGECDNIITIIQEGIVIIIDLDEFEDDDMNG